MCHSKGLEAVPFVAILILVGVVAVDLLNASCQIGWGVNDPTCVETDGSGHFEYTENTVWASNNEGTWTLDQALSVTPGLNIDPDTAEVDPASSSVGCGGFCGGTIPTDVSGDLDVTTQDGTGRLNAWNGINPSHCNDSAIVQSRQWARTARVTARVSEGSSC